MPSALYRILCGCASALIKPILGVISLAKYIIRHGGVARERLRTFRLLIITPLPPSLSPSLLTIYFTNIRAIVISFLNEYNKN